MAISRRAFFRFSLDEAVAVVEEARGRPSFRLSDLRHLSDERLQALIPAIVDASSVAIDDGRVVARGRDAVRVLYAADAPDAAVWPLIDGHTSLRDIATAVAAARQIDPVEAFALVRRVFLVLVHNGICLPVNPLDS